MFVCCVCCVLSGRGLCDEVMTCPEESYRLCYVVECDLETSRISHVRYWATAPQGERARGGKKIHESYHNRKSVTHV